MRDTDDRELPAPAGAYRTPEVRRKLTMRLGYAPMTTLATVLLAVLFAGVAAERVASLSSVEVIHREWSTSPECTWLPVETRETLPFQVAWLFVSPENRAAPRVRELSAIRWHVGSGPPFFLALALLALVAPFALTQRAVVTIDEGEDTVRIVRSRLGMTERLVRPLAELQSAEVVWDGWSCTARLRFRGEALDVAAPTNGDAGHVKLVAGVNAFLQRPA